MKMTEVLVGEDDIVSLSQVEKKICLNQWRHKYTYNVHTITFVSHFLFILK